MAAPSPARAIPHRFPRLQLRGLSRSGKTAAKEWGRQEKSPLLLQFPQQGSDRSQQAAVPEGGRAGVSRGWSCVPMVVTDPIPLGPIGVTSCHPARATTLCPGLVARIFVPCFRGTDRGICGADSFLANYNHLNISLGGSCRDAPESSPGEFGNGTSGFNGDATTASAAAVSGFKCHLPPSLHVAGLGKGPGETPAWKKGAVFGAGEEEAGGGM